MYIQIPELMERTAANKNRRSSRSRALPGMEFTRGMPDLRTEPECLLWKQIEATRSRDISTLRNLFGRFCARKSSRYQLIAAQQLENTLPDLHQSLRC